MKFIVPSNGGDLEVGLFFFNFYEKNIGGMVRIFINILYSFVKGAFSTI
jgi:hypothetical protein